MLKKFILIAICVFSKSIFAEQNHAQQQLLKVKEYISQNWRNLTRDITNCHTFRDIKMKGELSLYLPANFSMPSLSNTLQTKCLIRMGSLPKPIKRMSAEINSNFTQGLLYLPHPYVVPGGMFNEMYAWDSYFIIRGLLEDKQIALAKGMVENFFFEIDHYGGVLTANRGYYLTRSQPPFLTSMILAVYNAMLSNGYSNFDSVSWLNKAYGYAVRDYEFWISPEHMAGRIGLSRFYDFNNGPISELKDTINNYYKNALQYFLNHPQIARNYLKRNTELTSRFYQSDRALRESGLDTTFRFGPFGAGTLEFAPVDLNCLLYKAERDLEGMSHTLGNKKNARLWSRRASIRAKKINQFFWDKQRGLFFDYNFVENRRSSYEYVTTFYPLWIGLATPEQARAVRNNLKLFEKPGGLVTSINQSGAQWDYPFGWAPFHLIAIEGLRRYGYYEDANRLSLAFLKTIANNFKIDGTIREKYDVVTASAKTNIQFGYLSNEVGFGWTNGVFLTLFNAVMNAKKSINFCRKPDIAEAGLQRLQKS